MKKGDTSSDDPASTRTKGKKPRGTKAAKEPAVETSKRRIPGEIEGLKGVGPARAEALDAIGIRTLEDLFYYFPRRYVDRSFTENQALTPGSALTVIAQVQSRFVAHGKRSRLVVHVRTLHGEPFSLVFFRGLGYFTRVFEVGQTLVLSGKLEYFGGLQMAHPDFEIIDPDDERDLVHVGRIIPLYNSTEALKQKSLDSRGFRRLISAALDRLNLPEVLPSALLKKHQLLDRSSALRQVHYPDSRDQLNAALFRLKFEELFLFATLMRQKAANRQRMPRQVFPAPLSGSELAESVIRGLPFQLTGEQTKAIGQIVTAAQAPHPTAFLLQGDVGSGKTAVALACAMHYLEKDLQTAMMAPTEVLARQHFRTITDLVGLSPRVRVELLVGKEAKKSRELILERIRTGEANFVIGTHSLIEEPVQFHNLGLVVIDEQHRFGVGQREALREKGKIPDVIAMTATPIPRTLCLTEFADLELVTLKEKPAGRKPIKTMRLTEEQRPGLHKSIRKHVSAGRQCYIVLPVIEESEKLDLKAATQVFEELKPIFPEFKIELLHGRLKSDEKDRIMRDFRSGTIQILVTTTVIEVGVDVPNATIMVIEHADRFGISQLHQLRGRVGRGSEDSFCVLLAGQITPEAEERLKAIVETEDGFALAEVDLRIRGPGELLGHRQHGISDLRLADLVADRALAETAYIETREIQEVLPAGLDFIRRHFAEGSMVFPN